MVLLHICEHVVQDKHDHVEVLQQNTTEFRWGNIIEDIEVLVHELVFAQQLLFLEQFNQWLGVLGNTYGVEVINLPNHRIHSHMHS